jgi:hypothetical protein
MNRRVIAVAAMLLLAGAVQVEGSIFVDNFNGEHGGTGILNYTGFVNWKVTNGTVDLIGNGYFDFLPGNGLYVDMDGSTHNAGTMLSKILNLGPGTYRLSYDLAGSQRPGYSSTDSVVASVESGYSTRTVTLTPGNPFVTFTDVFTVGSPTTVNIQFLATGLPGAGDNVGLLLDNVKLESVVPEPATIIVWSLLAAIGVAAARRRRMKA